jgi:hypothetical protein
MASEGPAGMVHEGMEATTIFVKQDQLKESEYRRLDMSVSTVGSVVGMKNMAIGSLKDEKLGVEGGEQTQKLTQWITQEPSGPGTLTTTDAMDGGRPGREVWKKDLSEADIKGKVVNCRKGQNKHQKQHNSCDNIVVGLGR